MYVSDVLYLLKQVFLLCYLYLLYASKPIVLMFCKMKLPKSFFFFQNCFSGEEELQLQLALAMSREEAEQEETKTKSDDMRLQLALQKSKEAE